MKIYTLILFSFVDIIVIENFAMKNFTKKNFTHQKHGSFYYIEN